MSGVLSVIAPGLHTTVQDLGRFGYQAIGVPVSGALDPVGLRLANALVDNPQEMAALEILYHGPTIEVQTDTARIALAGANADVLIMSDPPRRIPAWSSVRLQRGERFRIDGLGDSACGYLAVEGGFSLTPVLGSLSTFTRSGIGGFEGRSLQAGDSLPLARNSAPDREEVRLADPPELAAPERFRVVLGPQHDYFADDAIDRFLASTYQVTREADRMGLRLDGPGLKHARGYNIVSDGIATGAIQVPGSGLPIVLLADHQTTGGYPKIATLISADLPAAGRLRPGDDVHFEAVSVAEAEAARRTLEENLQNAARNRVPADGMSAPDSNALYGNNLVSGVVNATD